MSIYSAEDLVEVFSRYAPDDQVVITWWDKRDVEMFDTALPADVLWDYVIDEADNALENCIGGVNDCIRIAVEHNLEKDVNECRSGCVCNKKGE